MFENIYKNKKVLITGHTGFKGSWLAIWLKELGADVVGYSLEPPSEPNNFEATRLREKVTHIYGDIRDSMYKICRQQIAEYVESARKRNLIWANEGTAFKSVPLIGGIQGSEQARKEVLK